MTSPSNEERRHLARGLVWLGSATAVSRIIEGLSMVLVLRFLSRDEIGIATLSWSVAVFAEAFNGLGIGAATQQRPDLSEEQKSSAFWYATLTASALTLLIALGAGPVASFYRDPQLAPMIRAASLKLLLVGLAAVPLALLAKELRYKSLAAISTAATLVSSSATLIFAAVGYGAWSPLLGNLLHGVMQLLGASILGPRFSHRMFRLSSLEGMIGTGLNVCMGGAVVQLTRNLDYLLLGRLVTPQVLGSYRVAFDLAMTPATTILQVANRAAFPVYASMRSDLTKLNDAWLWTARSVSSMLVPLVVFVFFDGVQLLSVLGKSGWPNAGPAIQLLCLAALARGVVETIPHVYVAAGKSRLSLFHSLANLALVALSMVAMLALFPQLDRVIAICIAWLLATLLLVALSLTVSRRAVGLSVASLLGGFVRPLVSLLGVGLALFAVRLIALPSDAVRLAFDAVVAAVVYFAITRVVFRARLGLDKPAPASSDGPSR